jgi:hypothetical protein
MRKAGRLIKNFSSFARAALASIERLRRGRQGIFFLQKLLGKAYQKIDPVDSGKASHEKVNSKDVDINAGFASFQTLMA